MQGVPLVVVPNTVEMLLNGRGGRVGTGHRNGQWILQITARKSLDLW